MTSRGVAAYPWKALESVTRASARAARRANAQLRATLDLSVVASALAELCECEVSLIVQRVSSVPAKRSPSSAFGFELGDHGLTCALSVEPELALNLLTRVLRRPRSLSAPGALDDSLSGAFSALLIEVARRAGARTLLHAVNGEQARERARDLFVELTALIAGTAYPVELRIALSDAPTIPPRTLAELGQLEIALPLVIGLGLAERAMLADFQPGNAWFPGAGLWLDAHGAGPVALAAKTRDSGISAQLSRDGKIVIRGESIALPFEPPANERERDAPMSEPEKPNSSSLAEAVLDSPIVVRVEMGAISLSAREWAELGPGDVIETGRRIAEPVVLRVAGKEVARGELVNLEGELGVRIRELVK